MRSIHLAAVAAVLSAFVAPALAQSLQPLRYMDMAKRPVADQALATTLTRTLKVEDPKEVLYQTYAAGDRKVTLIVARGPDCDAGPNSATSTQTWSTCPLRVVTTSPSGTASRTVPDACFLHVDRSKDPTDPDPRENGVFVAYDAQNQALQLRTVQGGKTVPQCTKSVSMR